MTFHEELLKDGKPIWKAMLGHSFLAEMIPFAKLEVIENAGYMPPAEAPEEVTACLQRWMKQPMMLR